MNKQIRVLRLLEYTGSHEDVAQHLANRGVKEISHPQWDGGKVTIRESFIENKLGGWEVPPATPAESSSFELAMGHLKRIDIEHAEYLLKTHKELFGERPTMRKISFATHFGMGTKKLSQLLQEAIEHPSESQTNPAD
jgi:hypothetical protein